MPSYAFVVANAIQSEGPLPLSARRLDTQEWVMGLATAPTLLVQACGYFQVQDTARPADTATDTFTRTLTLVGNVPTVTWVQRAKTQAEIDAATTTANNAALMDKALNAIAGNITAISNATTLRNTLTNNVITPTPSNVTQCGQHIDIVANQVINLTNEVERCLKQLTAIERLYVGGTQLLSTDGT